MVPYLEAHAAPEEEIDASQCTHEEDLCSSLGTTVG
jgi:hypothetical protein